MPLDAESRFILVRVKVERAKKHLRDLAADILALQHTTIAVRESDGQPASFSISMKLPDLKKLPTLSFDVVTSAGDAIHNLRAALDHLAHQLVAVGSPNTEPSRRVEFPIAKDAAEYEATKARKVEGMRPEAIEAIDRLKPYKGGNDALWRLHELDNIDKHRTLFTVAHDFLFIADWFNGPYWLKTDNPHFVGIEPGVEQAIQSEIEKAVGQSPAAQPSALLPALQGLVDCVESLILDFKPLLK